MTTKQFFNWCIMRYEDWKAMKDENERLKSSCQSYEEEQEALQAKLDAYENGKLCEGAYCESCKKAVPGDYAEYVTGLGSVITTGQKTFCSLDIPCPEFERKEE